MAKKEENKKKKVKISKIIRMAYKETKRSSLLLYLILRFLVILCMVLQILNRNYSNALLCLVSLVLLLIPLFLQNTFAITLPNGLEISIYLFIFSSEILGEINNFYGLIPYWDLIMHTLNGFLAAAVGFSLINLLNENSHKFSLSPFYLCLVAFCFSMTIGVVWEFFEYSVDKFLVKDMQKDDIITRFASVSLNEKKENKRVVVDNIAKTIIYDKDGNELAVINGGYLDVGLKDTMGDLFVNFIGAIVFSIFGYISLKLQKAGFISNFIPTNEKRKIPKNVEEELNKIDILRKS